MLRAPIVCVLLALSVAPAAAQVPNLTLAEVYETARERNPMLRAAAASAEAAAAQQGSAALPPDPQLQLGVMNASLPGLRTDMPGAMLPSVQAMQMVPTPGKLRLAGAIARQSAEMADTDAEAAWWEVRAMAAMAFYEVYAADRQLAVMSETLDWLRQLEQVATSMYGVGGGRQSDVLRAGVELARMEAEIARMRAMRAAAAARLNGLLDRPGEAPVAAPVLTPLPLELPPAETLRRWAEESRPSVERRRLGVQQAGSRLSLARRELLPDLTVGVQYGQRPGEMGTERMGSLMLGFSLPVFAGQRQMQMRREATAMQVMAEAELAAARSEAGAEIAALLAELERARTMVRLLDTEVLPQAEANVTSAFSAYRVGRVDFMTVLDAQMTLNEYTQELYGLRAEYGGFIARLERAVGRELPASTLSMEGDA